MQQSLFFAGPRGEKLAATQHTPEAPSREAVILGHCFTCSRHTGILRALAQRLRGDGFAVLRFDFSGNGQSGGDFAEATYSGYVAEMGAAVAFMRERGADWIGLAGHSMGAAVAVLAAARYPDVRAVCTLAGRLAGLEPAGFLTPAQRETLARRGEVSFVSRGRRLRLRRDFFADARRHDLAASLASLKIPLLVVHGQADETIPVGNADEARRRKPENTEVLIVPGADHMFSRPEHREQVTAGVCRWFNRVRPATAGGQAPKAPMETPPS